MTIILDKVSKRLQDNLIVNNADIEVRDGELFVLLGSSGSGKSTILRIIAGLLQPDSGRVLLHNKDVTSLPTQKRDIGFVFQNYAIFQHMTVSQNVEFGLKIRKVPSAQRRAKSEELLELVGLAGLGARSPAQLSGGQRQRVALARALAYEPTVLLLDEPFGALDVKIRGQLRRSLKEIQRQLKVTTILVTHDQEEAFELGDRIGILNRGRVVEIGTAEELYNCPQTEFVATFVGGGNVIVGRSDKGAISVGNTRLPFPPGTPAFDEGGPVRLMFRPEHVVLQRTPFLEDSTVRTLGCGHIIERNFAGSTARLRIALKELKDVRVVAPLLNYETSSVTIHASLPSNNTNFVTINPVEAATGQNDVWVGLNDYRVLASQNMNFMFYEGSHSAESSALKVAGQVVKAAHGHLTVLNILNGKGKSNSSSAQQLDISEEHFDLIKRNGAVSKELLDCIQTQLPDLIMLGLPDESETIASRSMVYLTAKILHYAQVPVLLLPKQTTGLGRILICTAGGEPGKSDILFGSRLARHIKSHVTVLQVIPYNSPAEIAQRAERHLARAKALLDTYNLTNVCKIARGSAMEQIVAEAENSQHDLIVIGAPWGRRMGASLGKKLTQSLLERSKRAVLIVPEQK